MYINSSASKQDRRIGKKEREKKHTKEYIIIDKISYASFRNQRFRTTETSLNRIFVAF